MESKTKYEFKNEAERIVLKMYDYVGKFDEVNTESVEHGLEEANEKPLDIYINSYGGEVFEGFAIYNILKRYKGFKTVYIDGIAASIASVIAMAGDKIVMNKVSTMMIHNASSCCYGTAEEMRKTADSLEQINTIIRGLYKEKSNLSEEEIIDFMNKEKFFTANECLQYGLCNEINEEEVDKDVMQNAMKLFTNGIDSRIKMLNSLKKAGFLADGHEPQSKENSAFFNTKKTLCDWLKGE